MPSRTIRPQPSAPPRIIRYTRPQPDTIRPRLPYPALPALAPPALFSPSRLPRQTRVRFKKPTS